jgi:hypothetical protein
LARHTQKAHHTAHAQDTTVPQFPKQMRKHRFTPLNELSNQTEKMLKRTNKVKKKRLFDALHLGG